MNETSKVKARCGDILVQGYDQDSSQEEANAIAEVMSKNWMSGVSEDDILDVNISRPNGDLVTYQVKRCWLDA